MKSTLILTLLAATLLALATLATAPAPAPAQSQSFPTATTSDVENPCDPTPGILALCKENHGRFSFKCCCCITH